MVAQNQRPTKFYSTSHACNYGTFITKKKGGTGNISLFRPFESNIEIPNRFCMGLDKFAAWIHRVAHEHIKGPV